MKRIELDKNVIDEIIRLYNEEMLGSPSISEKLGMNKHIVLRVLKENNIKVGVPGQKFKGGKKIASKKYQNKNKERLTEYHKEWSKQNRDRLNDYHKEWREKNIDKHREKKRNYEKYKKNTDPIYKLISNFRTAIYTVLKENKLDKYTNYFNMVGYTAEQLKTHLEVQFKEGMTWENYGEWHVDHIKPISSFTFETCEDEEFKICWSLDNLQPMWGIENIKKGNKNYL
jgi:hypothetical protein